MKRYRGYEVSGETYLVLIDLDTRIEAYTTYDEPFVDTFSAQF